jgi:MATE family multidrug resistance protein
MPSGPVSSFRTLIGLAWPIVLARATQSVMGFADGVMVAPLGEDALAATTTGAIDALALIILPMGIAFIMQSFAAQLSGKGRAGEARRYAWYGLICAAAAQLVALVTIPLLPWLFGAMDAEPAVRAQLVDYVELRILSVGGAVAVEVLGNWYGGLGNTRIQLYGGLISMASDMFFNWVLIYGHLGAPEMGVRGAALSSTIGTYVGLAALFYCFHRGLGGAPPRGARLRLRWAEMWRVIRFGVPAGINWWLEFMAFVVFLNVVIVDLGTTSRAAMNVVLQINSLAFMPAFGIASAGANLAGQAIGRDDRDAVAGIVKLTMRVTAGWMVGVSLIYLSMPATLIGLFASDPAALEGLLAVGVTMLQISAAWQLFDACGMTLSEILRAAGDTMVPMLLRLGLAWAVFTPVAAVTVLVLGGGEVAAMLCLVGYLAALAGLLAARFGSGAWRRIDLTGEPELV